MQKKIYIVRHCEAQGQPAESPLTDKGLKQAIHVIDFFSNVKIDKIISSPFLRAIQSVEPLCEKTNIQIEIDERLSERILSTKDLPDWYEKLRATFNDLALKFDGGESSQQAMERIVNVVEEVWGSGTENTVIVSHGNIISLLLKHYNSDFDFKCWSNLSTPDVFQLNRMNNNDVIVERIWNEDGRINI